jgi:hypothetical protein
MLFYVLVKLVLLGLVLLICMYKDLLVVSMLVRISR